MQEIPHILETAIAEIRSAADINVLEQIRVSYLGKKGLLTARLKELGKLGPEERPQAGQLINDAKERLQELLAQRRLDLELQQEEALMKASRIDITLPGRGMQQGGIHPVTRTLREIESLFVQAGFGIADGPEIEDNYHNFEALNIHETHPARAMHDTFYINSE